MGKRWAFWILVGLALGASLAPRLYFTLHNAPSGDLKAFIGYFNLMKNDLAGTLARDFTKLSAAYLYLWIPFLDVPLYPRYIIKGVTICFDYLCVFWVFRLVRLRHPLPSRLPWIAAICTAWAPFLVFDSSFWGQVDGVYTSFLIGTAYFIARSRTAMAGRHDPLWAALCYAVAFSFKLQATLFLPALAFFWGSKTLRLRHLLLIPAVYIALQLPRLFLGLPPEALFAAYPRQINTFYSVSVGATNFHDILEWTLLPDFLKATAGLSWRTAGTALGVCFGGLITLAFLVSGRRTRDLTATQSLMVAALSLWAATFFLPRMHDRYYVPAEIMIIAAAFYIPRVGIWALALNVISICAFLSHRVFMVTRHGADYSPAFLHGLENEHFTIAMALALAGFYHLYRRHYGHFLRPPLPAKMRPPRFYIICGNAAHNRGDRGNLSSQISMLRARFPEAHIVVDSYRPDIDQLWYDAKVIRRSGIFLNRRQIRHMARADVIIWGGGALIADNSSILLVPFQLATIFFVKVILGKKVMAWAQGIVIETKLGAILGSMALNLADTITVRDIGSYRSLKRMRIFRPHRQTADPAILLEASPPEVGEEILRRSGVSKEGHPLFAIAPTYWHLYHQPGDLLPYPMGKNRYYENKERQALAKRYNQGLALLCDHLVERYNARILLLPRYPSRDWDDLSYLEQVKDMAQHKDSLFIFDNDSYSPKDYYALWPCFDLLIGVALHDAIFSTAFNRPCVHLHYESKGKDFFQALDSTDRLLPWETLLSEEGREQIFQVVEHTLSHWPRLSEQMCKKREALRENARSNLAHLADLLAKSRAWQYF